MLRVFLDLLILVLTTDETLESEDGVFRVDDGLTLGRDTNETLTILSKGDY